jgi:hypothetical protein
MSRYRRRKPKHLSLFDQSEEYKVDTVPEFASTPEEIKRAVERNAINRGFLLIQVIVSLRIDELLQTIKEISETYDKEDVLDRHKELNIDLEAIEVLNSADPPIPYPYYFCTPEWVIEHPELFFYYRNVSMLSTKVMNGLGLSTQLYEENGVIPSPETAKEIICYLNGIIGSLVKLSGVSNNRHLEMVLANLGDSLGGTSRNEVGRIASTEVVRYIVKHLHPQKRVTRIVYTLKGNIGDKDNNNIGKKLSIDVSEDTDIDNLIHDLEENRVKYREVHFSNGYSLLLDKQIKWYSSGDKEFKIGPDFHSTNDNSSSMLWMAELKGGADPAGSDEHWKTATQALVRVMDASENTGRKKPFMSFIAAILVERVAIEAQQWIDEGNLTSVYNLTQIAEDENKRKEFLTDVEKFIGY